MLLKMKVQFEREYSKSIHCYISRTLLSSVENAFVTFAHAFVFYFYIPGTSYGHQSLLHHNGSADHHMMLKLESVNIITVVIPTKLII